MICCGKCGERHQSVEAVKACHAGALFSCHWAVERVKGWVDEDTGDAESWTVVEDCGAEAIATERGWTCAAGHEHVNQETQYREGWTYVEEYGEAMAVAAAGVEPRTMSGHAVLGPQSFERMPA